MRALYIFAVLAMLSCKKESLPDMREENIVMKNYCALGASTASQNWQREAAGKLALKFSTYSIPSACWTIDTTTKVNFSSIRDNNPDNVLINQVIRLLKDKEEKGYDPNLITIMCGLNDQSYDAKGRFGTIEEAYKADIGELSPEMWMVSNKADKIRLTSCGSMRFCVETLIKKFPDSKIVIFTVQKSRYPENYSLKLNRTLQAIAYKYDKVYLIDVYNESGIQMNETYLCSDLIHLNSYGERILTNFVIDEISKIF